MSIIHMLASDSFIVVNKGLVKQLGLFEAVILGELASEYCYWQKNDKLEDNWFYSTVENIESNTGISAYQQRQAIKNLVELGILETKKVGLPAKRYVRINEEQVLNILNDQSFKNLTTTHEKTEALLIEKFEINNNKINNNKKIINNNKKDFKILGAYNNIKLTEEHIAKLKELYGNLYDDAIETLSSYIESSGRKYKNFYAVLDSHNWVYKKIMQNNKVLDNKSKFEWSV